VVDLGHVHALIGDQLDACYAAMVVPPAHFRATTTLSIRRSEPKLIDPL
jgi:hypothetical protein